VIIFFTEGSANGAKKGMDSHHTWNDRSVLNIINCCGTAGDMRHHVCVLGQPTVSRNLKQVSSLARVWHKYAAQKISSMWCDVLWECKWSVDNVFVQEINIVSFWVGWIVIEG
jgi:hypothetical protein